VQVAPRRGPYTSFQDFSTFSSEATMPIYAYKCSSCGHGADVIQKLSDAPLTVCTACGQATFSKQITAAGFQLKGSGWYATDFKNGSKGAKKEGTDSTGADKPAEKSADAKAGETKPAETKAADSSADKKTESKPDPGTPKPAARAGGGSPRGS
jgi:putative FmdB family regulatory protein